VRTEPARIVRIALDVPTPTPFDYLWGDAEPPRPGDLARVPFGRHYKLGVVMESGVETTLDAARLRVARFAPDLPALPRETLDLARFCADYYHYPVGPILFAALPTALRRGPGAGARPAAWARLTTAGRAVHPDMLPTRASAQRALLAELHEKGSIKRADGSARVLRDWQARGWIEWCDAPASVDAARASAPRPEATDEQAAVLAALDEAGTGFAAHLLFGVTGSGKTELFLRAAERALDAGRQVLMLAPEIHLTPQLVKAVRERFPARTLVAQHSGMADGERARAWHAAASGAADIVLGTRLAVFTPLPRLGLIVVDEEHDASYKQQDGLRYSARDVAVARAQQRRVPVLLASATPSLESYARARRGRYRLHVLSRRAIAKACLPEIVIVDTRRDKPVEGLSSQARKELAATLARGEQSLVFVNRRGFAPVVYCAACAWIAPCPRCSANLVLHRGARRLRCHHCGLDVPTPTACPQCGSAELMPVGHGTQRIEEHLSMLLPEARILRVDRDSVRRKGAFDAMTEQIHAGDADVLVGTQMLAKGHHFPKLTLVVALDVDQGLVYPDYRAAERMFALLMQVAGRAGRAGHAGRVLIQTGLPHHPLFHFLARHDYAGYAEQLLAERREAGFPPFVRQALLRAEAHDEAALMDFLARAQRAAPSVPRVAVFDPAPALMPRRAGLSRAQLLVQSASRPALQHFLDAWLPAIAALRPRAARWSLDVDPLDFT
jgi:primosomal protein N' (replication factor Y)